MAHELEITNDEASMFSVKETPWHGLGKILTDAPTIKEGIVLAGLDWEVVKERLQLPDGTPTDTYATVRTSDRKILGDKLTDTYKVLQNHESFDFFDPFVSSGECSLETAGSLRGGTVVWVLAKLNREPCRIVGDDIVNKYILLSNSFDGKQSIRAGFSPIRVVCANTLSMAHSSDGSSLLKVKHSAQMKASLEVIQDIMNTANAKFEATAEQYRFLASKQVSVKDLEKYVSIVFSGPKVPTADDDEDDAPKKVVDLLTFARNAAREVKETRADKNARVRMETIEALFNKGRGNDMKGTNGTWWAGYNAITEYLQHGRPRMDAEARMDSLAFGVGPTSSLQVGKFAFGAALKMASAA